MYEAKCKDCGKTAILSFSPRKGKPVYCKTCLPKYRKKSPGRQIDPIQFNLKSAWAQRGDNNHKKKRKSQSIFNR
jgi:CxxC-x17-CxxC domain-containing protein